MDVQNDYSSLIEPQPTGPASSEDSLIQDVWHLILRRRYWVLLPSLLGLVFATFYVRSLPHVYDSSALIRISNSNSAAMQLESSPVAGALGAESPDLETEITVLQSRILALRVADVLGLYNDTRLSYPAKGEGTPGPNNPASRLRVLQAIAAATTITRQPHTNAIQILIQTRSPELSAAIANTLVNEYVARNYQMRFESQRGVSDWLGKQLDDLRKQTEAAQQRTLEYQKRLGLLDGGDGGGAKGNQGSAQSLAAKRIEALESALTEAQSNRVVKDAQYRTLSSANPEFLPDAADPVLADLRRQRASLIVQIREMSEKYGPDYPPLKQLKAGLDQANSSIGTQQTSIIGRTRSELNAARASEDSLRAAVEQERQDADRRNDDVVQYTIAKREFESSYELYEGLLGKLKEAGVLAGLHSSNVDIIDPAIVPMGPSGPHGTRFEAGGFAAGLILGMIIAFVIDSFDKSILSGNALEGVTGLPTIGLIPKLGKNQSASLRPVLGSTESPTFISEVSQIHAEAFRSLRTAVLLSRSGSPPKVILLTSSVPGEGKSTVSLNLSWALSQSESRILLLDCDLRRPTLMQQVKISASSGLCNILTGTRTLSECVREVPGHNNIFFLPTGPLPPNPAELLSSKAFANLLDQARHEYDFVVIDSPPVLSVTDPIIVAQLCDAVLFVVRSGGTSRHLIDRACRTLRRAGGPMIGSVLNWIDMRSNEYGYYSSRDYYTQTSSDNDNTNGKA